MLSPSVSRRPDSVGHLLDPLKYGMQRFRSQRERRCPSSSPRQERATLTRRPAGGTWGFTLDKSRRITKIVPGTPAETAGLAQYVPKGAVLTHINAVDVWHPGAIGDQRLLEDCAAITVRLEVGFPESFFTEREGESPRGGPHPNGSELPVTVTVIKIPWGLSLAEDMRISAVAPGSPAAAAGLAQRIGRFRLRSVGPHRVSSRRQADRLLHDCVSSELSLLFDDAKDDIWGPYISAAESLAVGDLGNVWSSLGPYPPVVMAPASHHCAHETFWRSPVLAEPPLPPAGCGAELPSVLHFEGELLAVLAEQRARDASGDADGLASTLASVANAMLVELKEAHARLLLLSLDSSPKAPSPVPSLNSPPLVRKHSTGTQTVSAEPPPTMSHDLRLLEDRQRQAMHMNELVTLRSRQEIARDDVRSREHVWRSRVELARWATYVLHGEERVERTDIADEEAEGRYVLSLGEVEVRSARPTEVSVVEMSAVAGVLVKSERHLRSLHAAAEREARIEAVVAVESRRRAAIVDAQLDTSHAIFVLAATMSGCCYLPIDLTPTPSFAQQTPAYAGDSFDTFLIETEGALRDSIIRGEQGNFERISTLHVLTVLIFCEEARGREHVISAEEELYLKYVLEDERAIEDELTRRRTKIGTSELLRLGASEEHVRDGVCEEQVLAWEEVLDMWIGRDFPGTPGIKWSSSKQGPPGAVVLSVNPSGPASRCEMHRIGTATPGLGPLQAGDAVCGVRVLKGTAGDSHRISSEQDFRRALSQCEAHAGDAVELDVQRGRMRMVGTVVLGRDTRLLTDRVHRKFGRSSLADLAESAFKSAADGTPFMKQELWVRMAGFFGVGPDCPRGAPHTIDGLEASFKRFLQDAGAPPGFSEPAIQERLRRCLAGTSVTVYEHPKSAAQFFGSAALRRHTLQLDARADISERAMSECALTDPILPAEEFDLYDAFPWLKGVFIEAVIDHIEVAPGFDDKPSNPRSTDLPHLTTPRTGYKPAGGQVSPRSQSVRASGKSRDVPTPTAGSKATPRRGGGQAYAPVTSARRNASGMSAGSPSTRRSPGVAVGTPRTPAR
eukprot:TRINITY_DN43109_c0_g1_i1.p1 TRINITY_DN43109_c0_g1~~TRINITY_DN43109_c0_g1_i1.p1  ORF type:complete len:1073 (+),score=241.94 TRINITY_DN43109_c0_g1_i1:73-3291(+)